MNKPIKLSILSVASILTLAACGNNNQSADNAQTAPETEQVEQEDISTSGDQSGELDDDQGDQNNANGQDNQDDQNDQAAGNNNQAGDTPGIENTEFAVSLDEAADIYRLQVGNESAMITEVQFDTDDGRYVYEFKGFVDNTEHESKIDAETGDVTDYESETENMTADPLDLDNVVSPNDAMAAAMEASGSGYIDGWELEVENGVMVYDFDFENANDLKVNAETGEVFQ